MVLGARSRGAIPALPAALAIGATGLALSGCGGGARADAGEPSRTFNLAIVRQRFPAKQTIARPTELELQVRNDGSGTVPDVAVSVDSLNYASSHPGLADRSRPVWAIEQGPGPIAKPPVETQEVSVPGGAQTAYVNTWALGPLPAGQTRTFTWKLVPIKPGVHVVHFSFAAGLAGKARAALAGGGGAVQGAFTVDIAGKPPRSVVDPQTGRVQTGSAPAAP